MIKRKELNDPNSCMNRAKDDEMTFVLLGRDPAAPITIRAWVTERIRIGKNVWVDAQIQEALRCAEYMEDDTGLLKDKAPDPRDQTIAELRENLRVSNDALKDYVTWVGSLHQETCSKDDTCNCAMKPINDAVNAAINKAQAALAKRRAEGQK